MANCTADRVEFGKLEQRKLQVNFDGAALLVERVRALALTGTAFAGRQATTLRATPLKLCPKIEELIFLPL